MVNRMSESHAPTAANRDRWYALDVLKGIGLLSMITLHVFTYWWLDPHSAYAFPVTRLSETGANWFPAFFWIACILTVFLPIAAGAAFRYFLAPALTASGALSPEHPRGRLRTTVRRAVLIAGLGFLMNVLAWGPHALVSWNVLQYYAVLIVLTTLILRFGSLRWLWGLGLTSLIVAFLAAPIQAFLPDGYLSAILIGDPTTGHIWPILPWLFIFIAGFFIAHLRLTQPHRTTARSLALAAVPLLLVGTLGFLLPGYATLDLTDENIWDIASRPPTLIVLGVLGGFLLTLAALTSLEALRRPTKPLAILSHGILPVYLIHQVAAARVHDHVLDAHTSQIFLLLGLLLQYAIAFTVAYGVRYIRLDNRSKPAATNP